MDFVPLLMDKKSAAKLLGISVRKLDYLIIAGELRVVRIGRRVLLPYRKLVQFATRKGM
jgi:excisionase family DNA binding protein